MNVRARLLCGSLLAALFLLFGCSTKAKSPLAPSSSLDAPSGPDASSHPGGFVGFGAFEPRDITGGDHLFFPLDSGSVWVYTLDQHTVMTGDTIPTTTYDSQSSVTTTMGGAYDFSGTPYSRSTESTVSRGDRTFSRYVFYRQDATGLYELDLPIRDPLKSARVSRIHDTVTARLASERPEIRAAFARALANLEGKIALIEQVLHAAGPLPATGPQGQPELQRLAYPLTIGRTWILRADPLFTETVEAREGVPVGIRRLSAWRIRIQSELFGPDDRVWIWVSRQGELRFRYHAVSAATDLEGNPVGIVTTDEDQLLVEYQLAGSPSTGQVPTTAPFGGRTTLRETPRSIATR